MTPRPLPAMTRESQLRLAVLAFRSRVGRRRVPPRVCCGSPGGLVETFDIERGLRIDSAQRVDVLTTLIEVVRAGSEPDVGMLGLRSTPPASEESASVPLLIWLERCGELEPSDADRHWHAATRAARAEQDLPGGFQVVTKHGWYDPESDEQQTWKRLRQRQLPSRR